MQNEITSGEPAIRTQGLTKHYGNIHALIALDLEVDTGEIFGFLGPNGAGKSTTDPHAARLPAPDRRAAPPCWAWTSWPTRSPSGGASATCRAASRSTTR